MPPAFSILSASSTSEFRSRAIPSSTATSVDVLKTSDMPPLLTLPIDSRVTVAAAVGSTGRPVSLYFSSTCSCDTAGWSARSTSLNSCSCSLSSLRSTGICAAVHPSLRSTGFFFKLKVPRAVNILPGSTPHLSAMSATLSSQTSYAAPASSPVPASRSSTEVSLIIAIGLAPGLVITSSAWYPFPSVLPSSLNTRMVPPSSSMP